MIFAHVDELEKDVPLHLAEMGVCLVADGWAYLFSADPYGPNFLQDDPHHETLPIVLVAKPVVNGFKVYWGTNIQPLEVIVAWGIRFKNEPVARHYFPMLKDIPFVKE